MLLNDDVELAPGALERCSPRPAATTAAPRRASTAPGATRSRAASSTRAASAGTSGRARLPHRRRRSASRAPPGSASGRSTSASSCTTRTSTGASAPARRRSRCASRCEAHARATAAAARPAAATARPGPTTRRATGSGCWSGSAARAARAARRRNTCGARAAACCARRVGRAKLARRARLGGAADGTGPVAAVRVAFDVVVPHAEPRRQRAGRAGLLDALPGVAPDVEIIQLGDGECAGRGSVAPEARRAAAGPRLVRRRASPGRRARRRRPAALPDVPRRRCATPGCRSSSRCTTSRCCASRPGSRPGAATTAARLMPRAVRNADRVICVSRATARDVVGPARRALPQPARDPERRSTRVFSSPPGPPPLEPPYLLFVGTPEPRKNLPAPARGVHARCARAGRRERLVLVGADGWGDVASARREGVVAFGRVDDAELRDLYAHAEALAYPSLWEGFGLSRGEALAAGCRVVVLRHPGAARARGRGRRRTSIRSSLAVDRRGHPARALDARGRRRAAARPGTTPRASARRALARARRVSDAAARPGRRRHRRPRPHGRRELHVNLLRELPGVAPDLAFACSLRDPGDMPDDVPALGAPARARRRDARTGASRSRSRRSRGARAPRSLHLALLRRAAPALPGRRDRARPLLHARAPELFSRRDRMLLALRAGLGAPCPARDRRLGVHARRPDRALRARSGARRRDPERRRRALPARSRGRGARRARRFGIDRPYVLFVGALQPRKNVPLAIEAYARLRGPRRRRARARGRRPRRARRRARARSAHSASTRACTSSGTSRTRSCRRSTARPSARFPSLYEGFGLPALEAMACGTPVVASNTTGLGEAVGDAGLTFDPTLAGGARRRASRGCSRTTRCASALRRARARARRRVHLAPQRRRDGRRLPRGARRDRARRRRVHRLARPARPAARRASRRSRATTCRRSCARTSPTAAPTLARSLGFRA